MANLVHFCFNYKQVVLTICFSFLFRFSTQSFGTFETALEASEENWSSTIGDILLFLRLALIGATPLFGWLADAKLGRFKTIQYSTWLVLAANVILSVEVLISFYCPSANLLSLSLVIISEVIISVGFIAFFASSLPFVTDQLIDASSDQLVIIVDVWYWSDKASTLLVVLVSCIFSQYGSLINFLLGNLSIAACYVIFSQCKTALNTDIPQCNPIKQIYEVLNFARKAKSPHNRSALTYCEDKVPSRFDLCEIKYGGPFKEEQVEDVKTCLRLSLILLILSFPFLMALLTTLQQRHMITADTSRYNVIVRKLYCMKRDGGYYKLSITLGIPLFYLILKPVKQQVSFFRKIAGSISMLQIIGTGLFLQCIGTVGFSVIEVIGHHMSPNASCMLVSDSKIPIDYGWMSIPLLVKTIGTLITNLTTVKFIVAQSPYQMKGLLFGCYYGFAGCTSIVGYNAYNWFKHLGNAKPSCAFYYYTAHAGIIFCVLLAFVAMTSKVYKLRSRNKPINLYTIISEIFDRYLQSSEENEDTIE